MSDRCDDRAESEAVLTRGYALVTTREGTSSLRHGDWKLIDQPQKDSQLYNLAIDPYEKNDLADSNADKLAELKKLLADQRAKDDPNLPADLVDAPK